MEQPLNHQIQLNYFELPQTEISNYKQHIQDICHKANNKTRALSRIKKFRNLEQAQVLAEAYILSNLPTNLDVSGQNEEQS